MIVSDEQPAYVQRGVQELAECLREHGGAAVQIVVGEKSVQRFAPDIWRKQSSSLGAEGFLIRNHQGSLLVTGATPQGTKYGLVELVKRIDAAGRLPHHINLTSVPAFGVRGMHLNGWAMNYPYAFRC